MPIFCLPQCPTDLYPFTAFRAFTLVQINTSPGTTLPVGGASTEKKNTEKSHNPAQSKGPRAEGPCPAKELIFEGSAAAVARLDNWTSSPSNSRQDRATRSGSQGVVEEAATEDVLESIAAADSRPVAAAEAACAGHAGLDARLVERL